MIRLKGPNRIKSRSSVSLTWTHSIIMIVLTTLFLCSLLLAFNVYQLTRTILRSMENMTEYLQHTMDDRFHGIQKIAISIELDNTNLRLKKNGLESEWITPQQYRFSQMIGTFLLTNPEVKDIAVLYTESKMIIGNEGVYPARSYYQLEYGLDRKEFEQWAEDLINGNNGFRMTNFGNREFVYVKKMVQGERLVGVILLTLDLDKLMEPTESLGKPKQERLSFGILLNDRIIALTGINPEDYPHPISIDLKDQAFFFNKNRYKIHIRPSRILGIHYLNAYYLPYSLRPIVVSVLVFFLGILGIGVLAAYLSLRISNKNSEPIVKILSKLGRIPRKGMDEYSMISMHIDSLLNEKENQLTRVQTQQNMIEGLFLSLLLNTDMESEKELEASARLFSISFQKPYYQTAVIKPVPGEKANLSQQIHLLLEGLGMSAIVTYLKERYVLLINLSNQKEAHTWIIPAVESVLQSDLWRFPPIAGLGGSTEELKSISDSYLMALTAMHETPLQQPGTVALFHRGMSLIQDEKTNLHLKDFAEALRTRSFSDLRKHFELLFARCVSSSDTIVEFRQSLLPLEELLKDTAQSNGISLEDVANPFFAYNTPRSLRHNILMLVNLLEEKEAGTPSNEGVVTPAQKARKIIQRDYTDPMLGLYKIAEFLEVSNSYLSTSFKNTYGIGVVQYINQLRVDLAKELILNSSMSIKDIAQAVGFASSISFNRVFKRYENTTPNSLRKG